MKFAEYKAGPAGNVLRRAGVDLDDCEAWIDLHRVVVGRHDEIEKAFGQLSTGEKAVLLAALIGADHSSLAADIERGHDVQFISLIARTHGALRQAAVDGLARVS